MLLIVDDKQVNEAQWDEVKMALFNLDNVSHTLVTLGIADDEDETPWMTASGGNQVGITIEYFNPITGQEATSLNPDAIGKTVRIKLGDEDTEIDDKYIVTTEAAVIAFHEFYDAQRLSRQLLWDIQQNS